MAKYKNFTAVSNFQNSEHIPRCQGQVNIAVKFTILPTILQGKLGYHLVEKSARNGYLKPKV